MSIITLTSDWGLKSHYQGAVKGSILRQVPEAQIVDITHCLDLYDIMSASFVIRNAYPDFPQGTLHIIGVNTEAGTDTPHVLVKYDDMYFIGADTGIFSLLIEDRPFEAVELDIMQDTDYFTFSSRDVFVKAAALICGGTDFKKLGHPYTELNKKFGFKPIISDNKIEGKVVFIDGYGNLFINIDKETFRNVGKGKPFVINGRSSHHAIRQLKTSYADEVAGERLALFGSTGLLEIAINKGNASRLLGLGLTDSIVVEFDY